MLLWRSAWSASFTTLPRCAANEIFGYSHMMAVAKDYQNKGVGARLKWAQRERALSEGRKLLKWTWDPMQARNAHFNLIRLGVTVDSYAENYYGIDYSADSGIKERLGLPSDRLFATWNLDSDRVRALASGVAAPVEAEPVVTVAIPAQWSALVKSEPQRALAEQARVREEFKKAFAAGLICAGFERGEEQSKYLFFVSKKSMIISRTSQLNRTSQEEGLAPADPESGGKPLFLTCSYQCFLDDFCD